MSNLRLRTVTRAQGNNQAVIDGSVRVPGVELELVDVPVLVDGFRRMVRGLEFDVCEMALTTYLVAREFGVPFTALPVFLVRGFHHGAIVHDVTRQVGPKDLAGGRVGVNRGYTVTTGVWARAILADEFGLDLDQVTWVLSGDEHVREYRPPTNVVRAPQGTRLVDLLLAGELDAVIGAEVDHPYVAPLIPHPRAAALDALRDRGHYPINHLIVVRDDVLLANPGLAAALFGAFAESKRRYVERLRRAEGVTTATDRAYAEVLAVTGHDPLPYGLAANRVVLEDLVRHATAQHIVQEPPQLESLFAAETLDLTA